MDGLYFDSRNPACKSPFGAVKTGQEVTFSLHLPKDLISAQCFLILVPAIEEQGEPASVSMDFAEGSYRNNVYRCAFTGKNPGVWLYHFEILTRGTRLTVMRGPGRHASISGGDAWQLTVYSSEMSAPKALGEGVMYQIFPDRFNNSGTAKENVPKDRLLRQDWYGLPEWRPNEMGKVTNSDYFGGDLRGIEEKLDYLYGLGVRIIYLNPIFEAHSNHRYNTGDYRKIDPLLGSESDFISLCEKARAKGMSVILDGVFSHTGSDSVYFNREGRYGSGGAYNDKSSPYAAWYRFQSWPDKYESWWGFYTLPNVDETEPGYMDFICGKDGVLRHWLELGAAGFRLDVADELPDAFLDALYACVKGYGRDCAVIGEVWEDASNKISYGIYRRYLLGKQMDSVMNYPFRNALISYMRYGGGQAFLDTVMQILENYPPPVISSLMNPLSTHDTARAITALGGEPVEGHDRHWQSHRQNLTEHQYWQGRNLFGLACIIQFGLPGIPCVYYGDEAGMCGYKDPFNRACYPWGKEDEGLVDFLRTLGKIRTDYPIFSDAGFVPLSFSDELCAFLRKNGDISLMFAANRSLEPLPLLLPLDFDDCKLLTVYGEYNNGILSGLSGVVIASKSSRSITSSAPQQATGYDPLGCKNAPRSGELGPILV